MDRIKTSDIYYGAYLLSSGGRLEGFSMNSVGLSRKITFEFTSSELERLKHEYLSGEARANVRGLRSALKHLKDIVLSERTLTLRERHLNEY